MSDSFTNFFNNSQTFGMNVRVPDKTINQMGKTATNIAGGALEPLFTYLEENENVFSGDVTHELNKTRSENFNITLNLEAADLATNGPKPSFDARF